MARTNIGTFPLLILKTSATLATKTNAIVKIKIFSSFTCPHCASFHTNVIPKLKKEYVDSGAVQLIFIDFPLDQAAFNASKLLHCIDKKKQINFLDIIYENQNKWTNGSSIENINNNLKNIVKDLKIPFIDIHNEVFMKEKNPVAFFPFELNAHYNEEGYKNVAKTIYNYTKDE